MVVIGTIFGVAIGRYPGPRMNRATIARVRAAPLVAFGILSLDEAVAAVGVESARRFRVHLSFLETLRAGVPITLLALLLGIAWLTWTA